MSFSAACLRAVLDAHTPAGATGLVVALSGGADSAALLAAASAAAFRGLPVRAVHVDHGLQAAAAAFRESCAAWCASLDIPLTVIRVRVHAPPGASIEAAARDARYAALEEELKPGECLLTAHHREDQAQTLLLQALRGAGLKGMSAMPICRPLGGGWHLRPLLDVPQSELLAFGASINSVTGVNGVNGVNGVTNVNSVNNVNNVNGVNGVSTSGASITDPMNEDLRFDRSYLRRRVWPQIESRWPGAAATLARAARHAADAQEQLDREAAAAVGRLRDGDALSVPGLRAMSRQDGVNALRFWLFDAHVEPPSTARLNEALRQLFEARVDHLPAIVWSDYALRRYRQRVFLTGAEPPRLEGTRYWRVAPGSQPGSHLDLGPNSGTLRWAAQNGGLDGERLPESVIVRRRSGGEALKPGAKARTRSVQHLCQSLGVLPWMRDALPLVFADDALIAVGDLWLDARWCVAAGKQGLGVVWEGGPNIV